MKNNLYVKNYLKAVKRELVCPKSLRNRSLCQLKISLNGFIEDHPAATETDIIKQFGSPIDFANAFLTSLNEDEIKMQIKKSKRVLAIIITTCIIALLLLVCAFVKMIEDNKKTQPYVLEYTITEDSTPINYGEGLYQDK